MNGQMQDIPRALLREHPKNPRKVFDAAEMESLAASMRANGVLTPLKVRPVGENGTRTYEIGAGHRRFRAAQLAGLDTLPCIVEELTDQQMDALLYVENLQRADIHPLDEAQGYAEWMKARGLSIDAVAQQVGKSTRYVYDTLRLLKLCPEAKKLYKEGKIERAHATILARLSKADQVRAISEENNRGESGVFEREDSLFTFYRNDDEERPKKLRTPRELQEWVDKFVRLDIHADVVPVLFPDIAPLVTTAARDDVKVLAVTELAQVPAGARSADEKTLTNVSWKRADGREGSKRCDFARPAIVVVGPHRGRALEVCIEKKKCRHHWPEQYAKAHGASAASASDHPEADAARQTYEAAMAQFYSAQRTYDEAVRKQWDKAEKKILEAVLVALQSLPDTFDPKSAIGKLALAHIDRAHLKACGTPATWADYGRLVLFGSVARTLQNNWSVARDFPAIAKALGIDLAPILDATNVKVPPKPKQPERPAALDDEDEDEDEDSVTECADCGAELTQDDTVWDGEIPYCTECLPAQHDDENDEDEGEDDGEA